MTAGHGLGLPRWPTAIQTPASSAFRRDRPFAAHFLELARLHVVNKTAHLNVPRDIGMVFDARHLTAHIDGYVLECVKMDGNHHRRPSLLFQLVEKLGILKG